MKKIQMKIIDLCGYIFTNRFHVCVLPIVLTVFWNSVLQLPLDSWYYLMIACTTAGGYIYNIYTDAAEDAINYPSRYRIFFRESPLIKPTIFACFFAGFCISLHAGWFFVSYGGIIHILASFYSTPLRLGKYVFRIKDITGLKNVYAGLHWSIALIATMYVYTHKVPTIAAYWAMVVSFLLNYFVEIVYDLRDIPGDRVSGVRTLPIVIGEQNTLLILNAVHVLACILLMLGYVLKIWPGGFGIVGMLHLPLGLWYVRLYRNLEDKELPSHLYLVYGAALLILGWICNQHWAQSYV